MVVNGENIRKIHNKIFKMTLKMPKMYLLMEKVSNKAKKSVDYRKTRDENADLLLLLFSKMQYSNKAKKLINHEIGQKAEKDKDLVIKGYIKESEANDKWLYLASSHTDSAEDHAPWQGKIYYDENAPDEVKRFAHKNGYRSLQWVMGAPVYFITRPNCRHFFKSLDIDVVKNNSVKELTRKYKMHRIDGDRSLATPKSIAIEEYTDRLNLLQSMYNKHKTEHLRRDIEKTKLLLRKWKNAI